MYGTIRSALVCAGICLGIFATVQWLRTAGTLSFLPESRAGSVIAVLGSQMIEQDWGELTAVFSSDR